ncbi:MAG TPA: TIGR00282 family metallophosphoesterase, partial [Candidatus Gracilibacteria bacterium]|nr:TIGR00282 family metallophosphoesterase [Candidatus Gracilibacteria bacterium]
LIRPANYPKGVPGQGFLIFKQVLVINLLGRVFLSDTVDSPFQIVDQILKETETEPLAAIIVDFHAETTSEKRALFHYLDGRVSAVFGTHTHVQTADEEVSEKGTAYLSDVGMCGPQDSVIGMDKDIILQSFLTGLPQTFAPAQKKGILNAVYLEIQNSKAVKIERIFIR